MSIKVLSRDMFKGIMLGSGITDETVEAFTSTAFICIMSSSKLDPSATPYFKLTHNNVLTLYFDDLTEKDKDVLEAYPGSKLMSLEDAQNIILFVKKHKDKGFFIHCTAGISRSGAVGEYIRRVKGISYEAFIRKNTQVLPNIYVLNMLMKTEAQMLNSQNPTCV